MNKNITEAVEELREMTCSNDSCKAFGAIDLDKLTKTLQDIDKKAREEERRECDKEIQARQEVYLNNHAKMSEMCAFLGQELFHRNPERLRELPSKEMVDRFEKVVDSLKEDKED